MSHNKIVRAACAGALTLSLTSLGLVTLSEASNASDTSHHRVTIAGAKAPWATPTRVVGSVKPSATLRVRVALNLRHVSAAERRLQRVSAPSSHSYGRYLSAKAFNARFGPSKAAVAKTRAYLAKQGLSKFSVAQGNRWIYATGSAAQLEAAFHTTLKTYHWKDQTLRSPASEVSLPASVARVVQSVSGLAQTSLRHPMSVKVVPDSHQVNVDRPPESKCSNYWGQHQQTLPKFKGQTSFNTYICGYIPRQLRKAYHTSKSVKGGTTGEGVTVAIIDAYASPTMESDANQYSELVGEPTFTPGQYTETVFQPFDMQDECGGEAGWNGEETLDVEAVHGMAPGADIHYIGAKNCDTGIDDAFNYAVQNHVADIISNSYGYQGEDVPPAQRDLEHSMFLQAGLEGIGAYFSSGDDGDNVINGLTPQPDLSSSDPLVTGVGGTSLLLGKHSSRFQETGWETSLNFVDYTGDVAVYEAPAPGEFIFGAGGGTSGVYREPYYQFGVVPPGLATVNGPKPMRVAPDISAVGDPYTGFYYGETVDGVFGIGTIGGTSLSCPLVAGIQALASQNRNHPIGFANPLLYRLPNKAFIDVVPHAALHYSSVAGSYLGTFNVGSASQSTARGYDNITGRGVPYGGRLIKLESNQYPG